MKTTPKMRVMPRSVKLMLEKYNKNYADYPPHKRKRLEVSCVIQATGIERLAQELEELARTLREGGVGYMGSGGGYYVTAAYAVTKRRDAASLLPPQEIASLAELTSRVVAAARQSAAAILKAHDGDESNIPDENALVEAVEALDRHSEKSAK